MLLSNVNINENNNILASVISKEKKNKNILDNIYIWCNLIDYSYANENNINSLYRIRNKTGAITIESNQFTIK